MSERVKTAGRCLLGVILLGLVGCATGSPGTFVTQSFVEHDTYAGTFIGEVEVVSSQTWVLYAFPVGDAPTVRDAMAKAKAVYPETRLLSDISIDSGTDWGVGYSVREIRVHARAWK